MFFVAIQSASIFSWVILVMIVSTIHEGESRCNRLSCFSSGPRAARRRRVPERQHASCIGLTTLSDSRAPNGLAKKSKTRPVGIIVQRPLPMAGCPNDTIGFKCAVRTPVPPFSDGLWCVARMSLRAGSSETLGSEMPPLRGGHTPAPSQLCRCQLGGQFDTDERPVLMQKCPHLVPVPYRFQGSWLADT